MGDLNTTQKARIIVTDAQGNVLSPADFEASTDDAAIADVVETSDQAERDLVGHAAGSGHLTVTGVGGHTGQSGALDFTVDEAPAPPLTVSLDVPAPQ